MLCHMLESALADCGKCDDEVIVQRLKMLPDLSHGFEGITSKGHRNVGIYSTTLVAQHELYAMHSTSVIIQGVDPELEVKTHGQLRVRMNGAMHAVWPSPESESR